MFFFPFKDERINLKYCFLMACFIHIALQQNIFDYIFDFETAFENSL